MSAQTLSLAPRLMRANDARVYLGSRQTLEDCEAAGWLKPKKRGKRLTIYSVRDLDLCADRIEAGDYPAKP